MIPKVIHYCWFGGNPLPEDAKQYIETWKKYCPDYQIIQWNESNFDINCCDYVKEAYAARKWAFVSDVARLYAMVNYGGVYMDTDVEVCKSLDPYLSHKAFSGFEKEDAIPTGIMACEKGFPLFDDLLKEYEKRHFLNEDGSLNEMTNVTYITNRCLEAGLRLDNTYQEVLGFALYPKDYFCPKDYTTGQIHKTKNTVTVHHFAGSWYSPRLNKWRLREQKIKSRYGIEKGTRIWESLPMRIIGHLYVDGLRGTFKKAGKSLKNR